MDSNLYSRPDNTLNTTAGTTNYRDYCPDRLPCGYCRLISGMCPLQSMTITWTSGQMDSEMFKVHPNDITYTTTTSTEVQK